MKRVLRIATLASVCFAASAVLGWADEPPKDAGASKEIKFKRRMLDYKFRSEGCAVGDFNHDGKMDVAAGSVYYAAPDWKMVPILDGPKEFDPHGYSESFANFAEDVNGDGRSDLVVVGFPRRETFWYEQPEKQEGPWKRHVVVPKTNNESAGLFSVSGDKKRELLFGWEPGNFVGYASQTADADAPWKMTAVSAPARRGRACFRTASARATSTATGATTSSSSRVGGKRRPRRAKPLGNFTKDGSATIAQMYVFDFDGDGDNDILSTAAHRVGMWWHEQTPEGWKDHEIDKSFTQTHALCVADVNGDKLPDFITGKRYWAHGPNGDIDPQAPPVVAWFELTRKDGKPEWIKHQIDNDSGVGTQFEVADINGDGLLDVAVANKHGIHIFEQEKP